MYENGLEEYLYHLPTLIHDKLSHDYYIIIREITYPTSTNY